MTELCDACGVLKDTAALVTLTGDNVSDTALTDDGVAVTSDTGVEEELVNITKSYLALVYKIFAVAVSVIAAGYRNLVIGTVKSCVGSDLGIIKGDRNLGVAHRLAAVRTAEDDILHLRTSEALRGDLTEYPTHSVRNIRFTASVRTDDDRCAGFKDQSRSIGERLEALKFYLL